MAVTTAFTGPVEADIIQAEFFDPVEADIIRVVEFIGLAEADIVQAEFIDLPAGHTDPVAGLIAGGKNHGQEESQTKIPKVVYTTLGI